jgi:three-Cys-motif partner protein
LAAETIPESYRGREQAYVKHKLLGGYLERLFLIVGSSLNLLGLTELCYVDCFAGPWQDDSDELASTSIAVALNAMARTRDALTKSGRSVTYRALFIEKGKSRYAKLKGFLDAHRWEGIAAEAWNGDFAERRQAILDWCGGNSFAFLFIDPTGWKDVGVNDLAMLLQRPNTEFLINFMYTNINRTINWEGSLAQVTNLLGTIPDLAGASPEEREISIIRQYCGALKSRLSCRGRKGFAASACVLEPGRDRTIYHLVYATCHPKGLIEFMEQSESVMPIQSGIRSEAKQFRRIQKTGQKEMFAASEVINPPALETSGGQIEQFWLDFVARGPRKVDTEAFARILEEHGWFPGEVQSALGRLIRAGKIRNSGAQGSRRTKRFVHYEKGETLQLESRTA